MYRTLSAFLLLLTLTILAQSQVSAEMTTANKSFEAEKWADAARAYEGVTRADPSNSRAWLQLGKSRLALKRYSLAIEAFEKNIAATNNPYAMLKTACAYARLKEKQQALDWLEKAAKNGISASANLIQEPDLDSLRDEPRFKEVKLLVAKEQTPCLFFDEAKQFDFWIGEWDVYNQLGQKAGVSRIERVSSGCAIMENWTNSLELPGKSINFYDRFTRKWYQYWIGSDGIPIRFEGSYSDNAMRYLGGSTEPDGKKTVNRLTFFNLDVNTVRQLGEDSTDGGKTFVVSYDLKYIRKRR